MDGWDRTRRPARLGQHLRGKVPSGAVGAATSSYARWSIVPSPNGPSGDSGLGSISCVGTSFCAAVGNYGTNNSGYSTLAEVWSGGTWSDCALPGPQRQHALRGVVYRYELLHGRWGSNDETLSERWNGSTWSIVPTPSGEPGLVSVSCVSQASAWPSASVPTMTPATWPRNGTGWARIVPPSWAGQEVSMESVSRFAADFWQGSCGCDHSSGRRLLAGCCSRDLERSSVDPHAIPSPSDRTSLWGCRAPVPVGAPRVGFDGGSPLSRTTSGWSARATPNPSGDGNPSNVSCVGAGFRRRGRVHPPGARCPPYQTVTESWNGVVGRSIPSPNLPFRGVYILRGHGRPAVQLRTSTGIWYGVMTREPEPGDHAQRDADRDDPRPGARWFGGRHVVDRSSGGYRVVSSMEGRRPQRPLPRGGRSTPSQQADRRHRRPPRGGNGYWEAASDGGIFAFGDASVQWHPP